MTSWNSNLQWHLIKRRHIEEKHPENYEKKFLCDICGKGFIFEDSRKIHKSGNHSQKSCQICGKVCFNKQQLKDHLSSKHKVDEMKLKCKKCTFSANTKSSMKSHIYANHKVENHKKCPYCEYHTHMLHRIQV